MTKQVLTDEWQNKMFEWMHCDCKQMSTESLMTKQKKS